MIEFVPHASSSAGNMYEVRFRTNRLDGRDYRLLVEAGLSWRETQRALQFGATGLDGVLISHHHGDHARCAKELAQVGVDVYASRETLEALGVDGHRFHRVEPLSAFTVGFWRVMPFDLRHDAPGTLGFLIESQHGPDRPRLLYACDTRFVPYRFRGLTHVALEANYSRDVLWRSSTPWKQRARVIRNHMSVERVVETLAANDLSKVEEVWLLHLSDRHSDEEGFKQIVECATGKPVHVAPR